MSRCLLGCAVASTLFWQMTGGSAGTLTAARHPYLRVCPIRLSGGSDLGGGFEEWDASGPRPVAFDVDGDDGPSAPDRSAMRNIPRGNAERATPGEAGREQKPSKEAEEMEQMRTQLLGRVLSREAYERLGNVQTVNPERARLVEDKVLAMARSGQLLQELTDSQMLRILEGTKPPKSLSKKIKFQRRSSVFDTIGLDPEYARKLGVETEGWDSPLSEFDNPASEYSDVEVPGSAPDGGDSGAEAEQRDDGDALA